MKINEFYKWFGKHKTKEVSEAYICPQTKKQCRDECCVSAEDCHIQAGIGIIFDCKQEPTSSQTEISDEEIEKGAENAWSDYEYEEGNLYSTTFKGGWKLAIKWYREQLKQL